MSTVSGLDARQLRDLVVRPTLAMLALPGGEVAERLVMGTAAQESGLRYLKQIGKGPALGLWQMEPVTFQDLWNRYNPLASDPAGPARRALGLKLAAFIGPRVPPVEQLVSNLAFACAMCRVHYYARPFQMPSEASVEDLAALWKAHYNTVKGAGKPAEFVAAYRRLIAPIYD